MFFTITELALLVIAGCVSATYVKSEGASSLLAAIVGVGVVVLIVVFGR